MGKGIGVVFFLFLVSFFLDPSIPFLIIKAENRVTCSGYFIPDFGQNG